jgi:polysaccharide biosynthesis/export protein
VFPFGKSRTGVLGLLALCVAGVGCAHTRDIPVRAEMPRELNKVSLPDYTIEPPDILQVDLLHAVPKAPYHIQTLDALGVRVANALPDAPISGVYPVGPDGTVTFGNPYGSVKVAGLTVDEARAAIEKALARQLKTPIAEVVLAQTRGSQQVRGSHLVRPDGSVGLGTYGAVRVVGMTVAEAKQQLEAHLSAYFEKPEVSVEVTGYNSKVYYVIYDGGGAGQQMARMPVTGNETVLDAVSQLSGLPVMSDARRIWISRPAPAGCTCHTLPVDWHAITECADTRTNYQILPGDRLFVQAYTATAVDNTLARVLAPIERLFGVTLLGTSTVRAFGPNNGGFGNRFFP